MKKVTDKQKAEHPEVNEMLNDLDKFAALKAVADQKGGTMLLQSLVTDIVGSLETIAIKYPSLTHMEFIALGADIKSKLDLARVIARARKNQEDLEKLIEETLLQ